MAGHNSVFSTVLLSFQFKKIHIQSAIFAIFVRATPDFSRIFFFGGRLNGMFEFRHLGEKMPVPYVFLRISHISGGGERGADIGTPHAQREIQLEV